MHKWADNKIEIYKFFSNDNGSLLNMMMNFGIFGNTWILLLKIQHIATICVFQMNYKFGNVVPSLLNVTYNSDKPAFQKTFTFSNDIFVHEISSEKVVALLKLKDSTTISNFRCQYFRSRTLNNGSNNNHFLLLFFFYKDFGTFCNKIFHY